MELSTQLQTQLLTASKLYNIPHQDLTLLQAYSNYIFATKTKILQITPAAYRSASALAIEVDWINYLNQNGLEVVKLVKSTQGRWLEPLDGGTAICYEKIIGQKVTKADWSAKYFTRLGQFTGQLHCLGKAFERERSYSIPNWDEIPKSRFAAYLPIDDRALPVLLESLMTKFRKQERTTQNYGLIHYDIHRGNYFLQEATNKLILFDFEMMCRSWYINEIAVILYYILNSVTFEEREQLTTLFLSSFFDGYRKEMEIDEKEKLRIPSLLLYRDLLVYGYTFKIWPKEAEMTDSDHHFRQKLSLSIEYRQAQWK